MYWKVAALNTAVFPFAVVLVLRVSGVVEDLEYMVILQIRLDSNEKGVWSRCHSRQSGVSLEIGYGLHGERQTVDKISVEGRGSERWDAMPERAASSKATMRKRPVRPRERRTTSAVSFKAVSEDL